MSVLDRYVARIALGALGAALLFFVFLTILVDLLTNVSRYTDRGLGALQLTALLAEYYAKLVPIVITTAGPFATAIAAMFTVARLQHANEVVPMLFVGQSVHRILRPILAIGVLGAAVMAGCWQWVVPQVGPSVRVMSELRAGGAVVKDIVHEHRDAEFFYVGQYFYVREFDPSQGTLRGVWLLTQGLVGVDVALAHAEEAKWDATQKDWKLVNGTLAAPGADRRIEWLGRSDLTPEFLLHLSRDTVEPDLLSYTDLADLMVTQPNRAEVRFAFHRHITWALANVLLLLLVLPMAVHYERGSRIGRVLAAIGFCGGYLLLDLTCQSLGQNDFLNPVVAAWVPPIVFGSLGTVLYGSTRT
jgi:lipopolysaccharide export LptBFGC system permease protein LptF